MPSLSLSGATRTQRSMANNRGNITETITTSNIDDIVQTLYNTDDELIGYSCKQVLEQNTVEPMDLIFYMDILSPNNNSSQSKAIDEAQRVILQELSKEYQIDPNVSKGVRCFDLPVDGSTWLVQLSIDTRNFKEITLFGKYLLYLYLYYCTALHCG